MTALTRNFPGCTNRRENVVPRISRRTQSGIVLVALAVIIGLAALLLVAKLTGNLTRASETDRRTVEALAQAKAALIGYAASYPERSLDPANSSRFNPPGFLPCPDASPSISPEGNEDPSCGATDTTAIGRLPWKSLGSAAIRDGAGECLWYAVSGNFKANPKTGLLNWDSNALIEVLAPDGTTLLAGSTPNNRAAAVIFAPGGILPGQDRSTVTGTDTCRGNYNAANYLDTDIASGVNNAPASFTAHAITRFVAAANSSQTPAANDSFNDRLVIVTAEEIFAAAKKRADMLGRLTVGADAAAPLPESTGMLRMLADCVSLYGTRNSPAGQRWLPFAAPAALSSYQSRNNFRGSDGRLSGRLANTVSSNTSETSNSLVATPGGGWTGGDTREWLTNCAPFNDASSAAARWWEHWKDHVFYAVADAYRPGFADADKSNPCDYAQCLEVAGATSKFAAVLIFAGERRDQRWDDPGLPQSRTTNADYSSPDKGVAANYLEGVNLSAINAPGSGDPAWGKFATGVGNDILMCVSADSALTVDPTCTGVPTGPTACNADGLALRAYRDTIDPRKNNCKSGGGKNNVLQACKDLANRLKSSHCDCEKEAPKFYEKPCIDNLNDPKCNNVLTRLSNCQPKP